jgi:hypothetical protein
MPYAREPQGGREEALGTPVPNWFQGLQRIGRMLGQRFGAQNPMAMGRETDKDIGEQPGANR